MSRRKCGLAHWAAYRARDGTSRKTDPTNDSSRKWMGGAKVREALRIEGRGQLTGSSDKTETRVRCQGGVAQTGRTYRERRG